MPPSIKAQSQKRGIEIFRVKWGCNGKSIQSEEFGRGNL